MIYHNAKPYIWITYMILYMVAFHCKIAKRIGRSCDVLLQEGTTGRGVGDAAIGRTHNGVCNREATQWATTKYLQ